MDKLTEFFKKKKLQAKFKTAGPGHKLTEVRSVASQLVNPVPCRSPSSSAGSAAAEAALKRSEQPKRHQNKALGLLMEEEKKKILAEMKAKEESQALKEQKPKKEMKYICPSLGITEGYLIQQLKEMIEEGIRSAYEDDHLLMSALLIKNCNDEQRIQLCVTTLELVLGNLRTEDDTQLEKFKRLRKAKIQQKILDAKGGPEFLSAVGFLINDSDEWCVLECENSEIKDKVEYCLDVLRNVEKLKLELDRELVVLNAADFPSNIDFGDEFYELTVNDVREEHEKLTKIRQENETLMTQAMRKKLQKEVPELCRLRVKVDQFSCIEVNFRVRETIHDFVLWLAEHFSSQLTEFDVIYNQKAIPVEMYSKTFEEMNFYPRVFLLIKNK